MTPRSWDIFCRVVDNVGDVGVCWRLARQLAGEHQGAVRLWVDHLATLHMLCREVRVDRARQAVAGVEVRRWDIPFSVVPPAEVVIEAFGCGLPEDYVRSMAASPRRSLWVVLEYLSAEAWVPEHHGLPSPHPTWPIPRYFFFPGFVPGTGGVLCENDLAYRRKAFDEDARRRMWESLGFEAPAGGATVVSMFAYDHAPVTSLLAAWEHGEEPVVVAVPSGKIIDSVAVYFGAGRAEAGSRFRRGNLEARILPFVEQPQYDELLWSCDCNFVRGEDSFVRAQWAGLPLVWHIYPQAGQAHWQKLDAFLELYCAGLSQSAAMAVRAMWRSWNSVGIADSVQTAWQPFWAERARLADHARAWAARLHALGDAAGRLAQFCAERVKC